MPPQGVVLSIRCVCISFSFLSVLRLCPFALCELRTAQNRRLHVQLGYRSIDPIKMAAELFRETTVGQLVHWLGKGKLLPYPEERADFVLPDKYRGISSSPSKTLEKSGSDNASPADGSTPAAVSSSATPARSSSSHDDDATLNNQPMSQSTDPEKSAKTGEPAAPKTKAPPGTIVVDW